MEEKEIWKDIEGFEGKYQVSNMGRVKSLNYKNTGKEGIMKPVDKGRGYLYVNLRKDGNKKNCRINRLVAEAFIQFVPEANISYEVDHRNTVRTDNRVSNLCYVTSSQNSHNPKTMERNINHPKLSKPIFGVDKITGLIVEFPSIKEAERTLGISHGNICSCLKGKKKGCGGFYSMYADADTTE